MNLQSSRVRDQMARIIRDEIRQVLRDELQNLQQPPVQQPQGQPGNISPVVRKARRLQPLRRLAGSTMSASPQDQQPVNMQQQQQQAQRFQPSQPSELWPVQQPNQPPNWQQSQAPAQMQSDQIQQQLAQEMESNLLKLKKVIAETQALAEKMESFLKDVGRRS